MYNGSRIMDKFEIKKSIWGEWPLQCPECGAEIIFGGTPDADYICEHYTWWVGMSMPWWINLPRVLRKFFRNRVLRKIMPKIHLRIDDEHISSVRPWGYYEELYNGDDCKVKRIIVKPDERLSYQCHKKRGEHWIFISGVGMVTLNNVQSEVSPGSRIWIPAEMKHRIWNNGNSELVFIEVQTGTYFGEDDIERFEDDYGRT